MQTGPLHRVGDRLNRTKEQGPPDHAESQHQVSPKSAVRKSPWLPCKHDCWQFFFETRLFISLSVSKWQNFTLISLPRDHACGHSGHQQGYRCNPALQPKRSCFRKHSMTHTPGQPTRNYMQHIEANRGQKLWHLCFSWILPSSEQTQDSRKKKSVR